MRKIYLLLFGLIVSSTLSLNGQILNQNASWGNPVWTLNGTFDLASVIGDPSVDPNFSYDDDNAGNGSIDILQAESPVIDLTAAQSGSETWIFVEFDYDYNLGDIFDLEYYDADAASWVSWESIPDNSGTTANWCSSATQTFTSIELDISSFSANQLSNFQYRLHYDASSTWGWGFCISSPTIYSQAPPACQDPSSLTVSNLTTTSADLGWTDNTGGSASQWDIELGTAGFTPTGTPTNAGVANPFNATGLTPNTNYEFYVRADCGGSGFSNWVGPFSFYTGYCISEGTNPSYFIDDFSTTGGSSNISNLGSGYSANGYQDATTMIVSQYETGSVDFDFTGGNASTYGFNIWVDWNNDLVFDPSEKMYGSGAYVGSASGTITVPAATPVGNYRMRIIAHWLSTDPAPCGTTTYTEAEDYTFEVIPTPSCLPPSDLTASNLTGSTADLGWTDNAGSNLFDIELGSTGFTPTGTPTESGITANPHNVTGLTPLTTYDYYVRSDCGGGDLSTWTGPFTFTTGIADLTCATGSSYTIYSQDFEGSLPSDWSNSEGDWSYGSGQTGSTGTGPDAAHSNTGYVYFEATGPTSGDQDTLWSPTFDLSTATNARFTFYYHMFGVNMGTLYVDVSGNGGNSWTNVLTVSGQQQTSLGADWTPQDIDLSTYIGSSDVIVRFIAEKGPDFESDICIDLFEVDACLTCPAPSNINISNITTDGGDVDWTAGGTETSWNIEYGPAGYTPGTGTSINTSNNPETLTGLIDNTEYDVYVQADCGGGDLSTWSGPANFTTAIVCPAPVALQLLGGTSGTQAELGWNITGTETDWIIEYGPTGFTPGTGAGTSVNTNTNPSTVTGLMPGVVYDFYVQADCGGGQNNPWEGPVTYSVPISNDAACDAIQVPVDGSTTTYINDGATLQTGEPTALGDNTVWFMFDAPASGHVEINTCGEDFDNFIKVYETTDCSDFNTFVGVDSATNNPFMSCTGVDPAGLNLCGLTAGNTYYLAVGSETPATTGAFPLTLTEIPNITAGTGTTSQVCAGDTVTLANALSGADAGGTWSEIDMSGGLLPGGLFSTNNLAYVNYRVEYKVENVCEADSVNVTVAIAGPSQAGQDGTLADCNVLTDFYLFDGLSGTVDFGGTWVDVDVTGRLNGSVFSPDSLAAGTYQFDYITTNGVCPADTSTVEVTIQDCLGTEDFTAESFKIFPNPTQGIFYIVSSVNAQDAVVEIMDLQGKVISSQQMNINAGAQFDFDLSQLERGVYLIKVATQENNTVKRVVLQR